MALAIAVFLTGLRWDLLLVTSYLVRGVVVYFYMSSVRRRRQCANN